MNPKLQAEIETKNAIIDAKALKSKGLKMFERKELIQIREKARAEAAVEGLNKSWARAYLRLADAADHLDAMRARCEEGVRDDSIKDKPEK